MKFLTIKRRSSWRRARARVVFEQLFGVRLVETSKWPHSHLPRHYNTFWRHIQTPEVLTWWYMGIQTTSNRTTDEKRSESRRLYTLQLMKKNPNWNHTKPIDIENKHILYISSNKAKDARTRRRGNERRAIRHDIRAAAAALHFGTEIAEEPRRARVRRTRAGNGGKCMIIVWRSVWCVSVEVFHENFAEVARSPIHHAALRSVLLCVDLFLCSRTHRAQINKPKYTIRTSTPNIYIYSNTRTYNI